MEKLLKAIKMTENVYWVGAIDWSIRDFHGYATQRGSTYNAYLITGEKNVLIDVVKKPFKDELISRIKSVIDIEDIDYIISNHSELDHTGSLEDIIDLCKPEKVFASRMGVKTLKRHFHWDKEIIAVKPDEKLDIGKNLHLSFIETKMLHWPDSMFTYLDEEKLLFSQDAFGMHLATGERFVDQCSVEIVYEESEKYFANILLPYAPRILNLIKSIQEMGLEIDMIAPDHGPIWRKDILKPITWYQKWSEQKPTNKVIIIFDTMWNATENMALTISEALIEEGVAVKVMPLKGCHRTDIIKEISDAGGLLVGSPTLNNNIFPTIADILTYIRGLKPKNLIGGSFGSFGWSGEGIKQVNEYLESMEIEIVDSIKVQYRPSKEELEKCTEFGKNFAAKLKEYLKGF
jgi:flavorubredoxin